MLDFLRVNWTCELEAAGFILRELKKAGISAEELMKVGFDLRKLKGARLTSNSGAGLRKVLLGAEKQTSRLSTARSVYDSRGRLEECSTLVAGEAPVGATDGGDTSTAEEAAD